MVESELRSLHTGSVLGNITLATTQGHLPQRVTAENPQNIHTMTQDVRITQSPESPTITSVTHSPTRCTASHWITHCHTGATWLHSITYHYSCTVSQYHTNDRITTGIVNRWFGGGKGRGALEGLR